MHLCETVGFYWYGWWRQCNRANAMMWYGIVSWAATPAYISNWALNPALQSTAPTSTTDRQMRTNTSM